MLVPVPKTAAIGGQPLRDTELLTWCGEVIRSVLADLAPGVLFRTQSSPCHRDQSGRQCLAFAGSKLAGAMPSDDR
jgi:hypothetical protein